MEFVRALCENDFERYRNAIVAALYRRDCEAIIAGYRQVYRRVEAAQKLSEAEQKALNQIHAALRKFRQGFEAPWEPGITGMRNAVRKRITATVKTQIEDVEQVAYALQMAIHMPLEERRERHQALLATIRKEDVHAWSRAFLTRLQKARPGFGGTLPLDRSDEPSRPEKKKASPKAS